MLKIEISRLTDMQATPSQKNRKQNFKLLKDA